MFEYFTNPDFRRKKRGIFGEEVIVPEAAAVPVAATLTPSFGKSEFNEDWIRQRREADSSIYPNIIQGDESLRPATVPTPILDSPEFNAPTIPVAVNPQVAYPVASQLPNLPYERDELGIPKMPVGASITDKLVKSDGTQSDWNWGQMEDLRKGYRTSGEMSKNYDDMFYPNGVRRSPMDERLPSGETMYDATERLMKQGNTDEEKPANQIPYPVVQAQTPAPTPSQPIYPRLPSADTQGQINAIYNKDYSKAQKDAEGNIIKPAGKDRDKKWSTLEKIGNAAMGALLGLSTGGIGGAVVGGIQGATNRNYNEQLDDKRELAQLYPRLKQQQESETIQTNQQARQAQTQDILRRPEKEAQARQDKFDLESKKQLGRMEVLQAKEASEGKKWTLITKNGKFFKKFPDREEPLIDPTTGQQETNLLEMPIETTSENGVKGYTKFGTILNAEATKNYRDAMVKLGEGRLEETKKQNSIRNAQWREQFNENRKRYTDLLDLKKQAQALQAQALASKDGTAAAKAEKDAADLQLKIDDLKVRWQKRIDNKNFTEEEYQELIQDLP